MTRPPRLLFAVAVLLLALCVLGSGRAASATAAGTVRVKVPLPSRPMSGADAREVAKAATATWRKIRGAKAAPGLWVGVWDPQRGYWEGAFGKATRGGRATTTKDHLRIGSITKTFTATVVLGLVAERKLPLGGTVGRYDAELAREFPPLEEKVEKPGTPGYSTTNYIVLQLIAEAVSGDSLEGLIAERVTRPLGLSGTALQAPGTVRLPSPGSGGYVGEAGAREFVEFGAAGAKPGTDVTDWSLSWAQGGGGMYSTLHDLGVWAASGVGNALLPKWLAAKRFATKPTPVGEYGLGVQRLGDLYGHTGETFGAETFALNDAKTGVTFVIAANQTSALSRRFLDLLFRLYPGEQP